MCFSAIFIRLEKYLVSLKEKMTAKSHLHKISHLDSLSGGVATSNVLCSSTNGYSCVGWFVAIVQNCNTVDNAPFKNF